MTTVTNIIKEITEDIEGVKQRPMRANVGSVVEVKDEVVFFSGFDNYARSVGGLPLTRAVV